MNTMNLETALELERRYNEELEMLRNADRLDTETWLRRFSLIYGFLDEVQQRLIELGGKPS